MSCQRAMDYLTATISAFIVVHLDQCSSQNWPVTGEVLWHTVRSMVVEMRTYKTKPGKRAEFLEIFRTRSMPAHAEIGMPILGPFLSIEDADTFFFMRGFPDLASREPMKAKFYEGALWKGELEQMLLPMLDKYDFVLVDDPGGLIRW